MDGTHEPFLFLTSSRHDEDDDAEENVEETKSHNKRRERCYFMKREAARCLA